jgi:hypothetical protein
MTPEEFKKALTSIAVELTRSKGDLLLLGGKDIEGRMKQRIFNKGLNSSGSPIGQYKSKSWIKKRKSKGRSVGKVDLEFSGDLRNSIQTVADGSDVVVAIINDREYLISQGQEKIQGAKKGASKMPIFEPSDKEVKATQDYINDLIEEKIENILRGI